VSVVANASSLSVRDSDGSNILSIAVGSNLTANTILTLTTGATSNRTLDISASNVTISTAGAALIDDADASAQRTTLGLGTISTQNANAVAITGGSISGITDLAVADGGTGASDAANARTNLGIGTLGTQNANAVAITGGTIVANASGISIRDADASNVMTIAVGSNLTANTVLTLTTGAASNRTLDISASNVTISTAGAALIDDADASAQRTTLGLGTISTQNANAVSITGGSVTGITDLALADGGTGASLVDPNANAVLGWNDTAGAMTFLTAGTGISINATANTISSTVTGGGNYVMQVFTNTTPGGVTWTKPANLVAVKVTVVGGGGGLQATPTTQGGGGGGGAAIGYLPAPSIPGPITVTVGAAGGTTSPTLTGGTSSFGALCSATGGAGNGGAGGTGTGGTINFSGQRGGSQVNESVLVQIPGPASTNIKSSFAGSGGNSIFGGGGASAAAFGSGPSPSGAVSVAGSSGYTYGGGASGKVASPSPGVVGFQGVVIIEEFY
jgi:hypothetical protein